EFPIMSINLAADYSLARLKEVAEDLETELEKIQSILEVDVVGGLEREVQVNIDLSALQGYNITFMDIVETLREENSNIPGGSVDVDRLNYLVRVTGEFETPDEIESLVIESPGGKPIYVRDIADVDFGFKKRDSYARLQLLRTETEDGELLEDPEREVLQVISLNVKQRSGENITEIAKAIDKTLANFTLPPGTRLEITGDMSENIESLLTDLENNIISGLIFVVAVLLFFLGIRTATLVAIAIPLSMFLSFIIFQALGQTLNFIILFSLIIALGMLVDNAIVIVENIYRHREMGHSRFESARLGTKEVAGPVVASTATTVAAFVPMLFWPGIIGEFMSYLPMTLIITLTASLFVALIINPVITGIFVKLENEESPPMRRRIRLISVIVMLVFAAIIGLSNWKTLVVLAVAVPVLVYLNRHVFKKLGDRFMESGLPTIIRKYREFLHWMLERDYTVKRAYLRNTFALASFTVGFALVIIGAALKGAGPEVVPGFGAAGFIVFLPGIILLVLGVIGIVLHSFESIYLGGWKSVKAGAYFGGVM
ncbi:MAG: efflux RND transporter permease subunit, partial [Rhodothermales bacterium]